MVLLIIAALVISATFDPNAYKPQIIQLVQEKKQRTLSIPGDIKLTFFPKIGADLGKLSISEHNNSAVFASVEGAKVSLALMPLLRKNFVIDHIKIDGLTANLKRYKDGKTNVDDLLSKDKSESQSVAFDIDGVSLTNANITVDDQMAGRQLAIAKGNLKTGRIASGKSSDFTFAGDVTCNNPKIAGPVTVKSGFNLDLDQKHYVFNGFDAEIKGQVASFTDIVVRLESSADLRPATSQINLQDLKLSATGKQGAKAMEAKFAIPNFSVTDNKVNASKITGQAKMSDATQSMDANFSVPAFDGTPQSFTIPAFALDATVKQGEMNAKAKLTGPIKGDFDKLLFTSQELRIDVDGKQGATEIKGVLTTPLSADMKAQVIQLANINTDLTLPNPNGGTLALKANGNANVNLAKQTLASQLKAKLDQSTIDAKLGLSKFSPPAYTFDIAIDQIDVDRYSKKTVAVAAPETKAAAVEQPIDLSALKDLNANGALKIGSLKVANIKASNVRLNIHAANGKLTLNPLAANLYQGSLSGDAAVTASNPPQIAIRENLSGVSIGPFLKDAVGKEPLEGHGSVQLDVTAQGATVSAMKKALNGNAKFDLRDGAVHGINIAQTIRSAKAKLGGAANQQSGTSSTQEKSDFSELSGSFRITNGIAHNEDLSAKSPLLRVGGRGDINLGNDTLDYTVKATVVSSLQGQGGAELQALKGVTIPVRLSGPLHAMAWNIDFAGMATEVAKQKIDEKKEEVKAKAKEKLQDQLKGGLKGLFGR